MTRYAAGIALFVALEIARGGLLWVALSVVAIVLCAMFGFAIGVLFGPIFLGDGRRR